MSATETDPSIHQAQSDRFWRRARRHNRLSSLVQTVPAGIWILFTVVGYLRGAVRLPADVDAVLALLPYAGGFGASCIVTDIAGRLLWRFYIEAAIPDRERAASVAADR
jgi:hypothetical protein